MCPNDYAWAIQNEQIAERIHHSISDTDEIEDDRFSFGEYLQDATDRGVIFKTQLEAWEGYNIRHPVEFSETVLPNTKLESDEVDWQKEIQGIIASKEKTGNYSETGGQQ